MKKSIGALFLLWTGAIVVAFYVVQKPGVVQALAGLADTLWTVLVAVVLLFNAHGIGGRLLHALSFESHDPVEHLLLGWGMGLGALSLLGLFLSIAQLANGTLLTAAQILLALFFLFRNELSRLRNGLGALASRLNLSFSRYSFFTRLAVLATFLLSFLLALVPPFEAFDALLYHLTLPADILKHGGLYAADNPPYWFPSLVQNVYLWALGMGSERAPQLLHLSWTALSALLLWHWSVRVWDPETGRKAMLLLVSIPSLTMLASWAYADMPLVFYALAAVYALTGYRVTGSTYWLTMTGCLAGFAMSIKYTSFVVPLACGLLLFFHSPVRKAFPAAIRFALTALAVTSPWYIRNLVYMGNPFYPFVFGGRYWDDFLARWYADAGTGTGWDAVQLLLLPLNTTLGIGDVTYFDGRIGPLFLILAPLAVWILLRQARPDSAAGWSLLAIGVFSLLSFAAWTLGVISSSALWQARLLLPALVPFAIPTARAWESLRAYDTSRLRTSFLIDIVIGIVITLAILDNTLFVLQRNPLAVAVGAQSRERYVERVNPSYATLMTLVEDLPPEARIYSLFEPRSYGLARPVQPDPILSNFAHDMHLYKTAGAILQNWKSEQYSHILVYERGLEFMSGSGAGKFTPEMQIVLHDTLEQLRPVARTPDNVYSIYEIQ